MPLIILCGLPCSGKSTRASEIFNRFQTKYNTKLVQDEDAKFRFDRNELYKDTTMEKEFRNLLKSELEKHLTNKNIIILDASNYIGGYRYELYCVCKLVKTSMCTILCSTSPDVCLSWNAERSEEKKYTCDIFDALVERFEKPDSKNKWDSPLLVLDKDEKCPFEEIESAIFQNAKKPKKSATANSAVQPTVVSSDNFFNLLNKQTMEAVDSIIQAQAISNEICIPGIKQFYLAQPLEYEKLVSMRRQFINMMKVQPSKCGTDEIVPLFVQYINRLSFNQAVLPNLVDIFSIDKCSEKQSPSGNKKDHEILAAGHFCL